MGLNLLENENMHYKVLLNPKGLLTINGLKNIWISYEINNLKKDNNLLLSKMDEERKSSSTNFIYYEIFNRNISYIDKLNNGFDSDCYFDKIKNNDFTMSLIKKYLKKFKQGMWNDMESKFLMSFLCRNDINTALHILQYLIFHSEKDNNIGKMLAKDYLMILANERNIHIQNNIMYIEFYTINLLNLNNLKVYY
ncbi:hypothetical protein ACFO72_004211 [Enterobacter roggenkampii]|uniref:hypothetical protein n=1 Tax=Enterobacter cloacae TaxID=550 RepID=UPI0020744BAA|nr:hypothetical protein [Enterobacter cloacae]